MFKMTFNTKIFDTLVSFGYEKLVKIFSIITEVESILIKSTKCTQFKLQHNNFHFVSYYKVGSKKVPAVLLLFIYFIV